MATEFVGRFHGCSVAVGLQQFGGYSAKEVGRQRDGTDPLQLGDLAEEVLKSRTAGIGTEFVQEDAASGHGRLVSTGAVWLVELGGQQRVQRRPRAGRQAVPDVRAPVVLEGMEG